MVRVWHFYGSMDIILLLFLTIIISFHVYYSHSKRALIVAGISILRWKHLWYGQENVEKLLSHAALIVRLLSQQTQDALAYVR